MDLFYSTCKTADSLLDLIFTLFECDFGTFYQSGTELWYLVKVAKYLQSLQCTRAYGKSVPLDDLNNITVTDTLEDGSQKTIRHEQYVSYDDVVIDEMQLDADSVLADSNASGSVFPSKWLYSK